MTDNIFFGYVGAISKEAGLLYLGSWNEHLVIIFDDLLQNFLLEKDILISTKSYSYPTFVIQKWK